MRKAFLSLFTLLFCAGLILAVPRTAAADDDDPPGRVARLSYIQGAVSFQPGGEEDWLEANRNRPLTTGDRLWTDRGARAELHIGSTAIRLRPETSLTFLNLDDRTVQIQLAQGSAVIRVRRLDGGDAFEVDTPNLAFSVLRAGEYRISVDPDGATTEIAVRSGEGEVTGGGRAYELWSGQRERFSGTDTLAYDTYPAGGYDDFDDWSRSRDDREDRAISARYVSRDVIGYDDLDDYGSWRDSSEYGQVWVPSGVPVGWAPYRYGHWAWIEPWGWTWVEDEPWGFAPFHYGRWAYAGNSWFWVPGPVVVRPYYAPALVAFVGGGETVGWFPLGPREVYIPAYRCSPRYVQNVNITNTTVNNTYVTNVYNNYTNNVHVTKVTYVNQAAPGALTAVSRATMTSARPVAPAAMKAAPKDLQTAPVVRTIPVPPEKKSILGAGAPAPESAKPPAVVVKRQGVAKLSAPPPPVPYARKQPVLQANPGRPPERAQVDTLRKPEEKEHPLVKPAPPVRATEEMYHPKPEPAPRPPAPAPPAPPTVQKEPARPQGQERPREPQNPEKPQKPEKPIPPTPPQTR